MEVLLLTDEADLESALPELESFAQSVQRAPLDDPGAAKGADADVAIIDARADLAAARRVCRRLTTSAPALAVVAVVAPANFVAVDGDWIFDDVLLNAAGGAELQARLRLAITRRRSTLAGTLQFGDLVLLPSQLHRVAGRPGPGADAHRIQTHEFPCAACRSGVHPDSAHA